MARVKHSVTAMRGGSDGTITNSSLANWRFRSSRVHGDANNGDVCGGRESR